MAQTYFASDWHLGHVRIAAYCGRPADWEARIFNNLSVIQPDDTLIHLGDFAFRQKDVALEEWWKRMPPCKKILIEGNHDRRDKKIRRLPWDRVVRRHEQPYRFHSCEFNFDAATPIVKMLSFALKHDPDGDLPGCDVFVHGHQHEKGVPFRWAGETLVVDVSCEKWNYELVSLERVLEEYKKSKPRTECVGQDSSQPG